MKKDVFLISNVNLNKRAKSLGLRNKDVEKEREDENDLPVQRLQGNIFKVWWMTSRALQESSKTGEAEGQSILRGTS